MAFEYLEYRLLMHYVNRARFFSRLSHFPLEEDPTGQCGSVIEEGKDLILGPREP